MPARRPHRRGFALIDHGFATLQDAAPAPPSREPTAFDFRRPSKFAREHVRSLEALHETFSRRFASAIAHGLRAGVQLRPVAIEEITYENYLRSLPNPSVLALVALRPLPGEVLVELGVPLALVLVDRALGGLGVPVPIRRPTELETRLLAEVVRYGTEAFRETFAPLLEVEPEVLGVETNPSFVQVVPPSETTLLLSYTVSVSTESAIEGLLTVCYPHPTLQPVMDRLQRHVVTDPAEAEERPPDREEAVASHLGEATVPISVQLSPTRVDAAELAALAPGDVLRTSHRIEAPVRVLVGGVDVLAGYLGRRGRRVGVRIVGWSEEGGRP